MRKNLTVETRLWLSGLNLLSRLDDRVVQEKLRSAIPGHLQGKHYRLPTEAEREFVQRARGFAEGKFSPGNTEVNLCEWFWFEPLAYEEKLYPVGLKKPILVEGRPVYDISGNVYEMVSGNWADRTEAV